MAIRSRVHTISPPAVLVSTSARRGPHDTRRVIIQAEGDVYVGGKGVDETIGLLLSAGERLEITQSSGDDLHVMPVADDTKVRTLETRAANFTFTISRLPPLNSKFGDYWQAANGHQAQLDANGLWEAREPETDNICVLLGNQLLWIGAE